MNDAKFKGVKLGDKSMATTFTVTMKDSKRNSAMQAFEMANEVYLLEQKRKEERMKVEPVEEEEGVEEEIEIEDKPDDN